jgi:hypothetical protein
MIKKSCHKIRLSGSMIFEILLIQKRQETQTKNNCSIVEGIETGGMIL